LLLAIGIGAAVFTLALLKPFDWGRLPWSEPYFQVRPPGPGFPSHSVVVMLGQAPMSYVIPSFPASDRFVRPQSNFTNIDDNYGFTKDIKDLLQRYHGRLYVLYDAGDSQVDLVGAGADLGADLQAGQCGPLGTNTGDHLELCDFSSPAQGG
jgi:hypothetical protein